MENEHSALESVEDNEMVSQGTVSHVNDDKTKINGSCSDEIRKLGSNENDDANVVPIDNQGKGVQSVQPLGSPLLARKSSARVSPPMKIGYGLKKWRRIKRDVVKDAGPSADSGKVLKRGLSGSDNPIKPSHFSLVDIRQNSEGSVGSANVVKNVAVVDGYATTVSSLDSKLAVGSAFAVGTDSENSEDRSSKSSTAASAPKLRFELPSSSGHVRERNRMKNLIGKTGGNPTQRVQQGKTQVESIKKQRGETVKIEKENSRSSMESDSRSSNFVFMQGNFSVTSNGRQSGLSMNYDGENSDDAHACEQQFSEEVQTGYAKENVGEVENILQDDLAADLSSDAKEEKSENHRSLADRDPLVESLLTLQAVQEALENEVQKFREIEKDAVSLHDNSLKGGSVPADPTVSDPQIHGPSSFDNLTSGKIRDSASSSLEMQVLSLMQSVKHLESKLDDTRAVLEMKELRIAELEATLNSNKLLKEESGSTIELQPEQCREMVTELEGLFRQKIEAEIEYLALTRTIEMVRVTSGDQITLIEEQETLAEEQTRMLNKLGEAESRAAVLKKQVEELEKYSGDVLGTEVILKMPKMVCKTTMFFIIQLILLVLVRLFVLQLSPHSGVSVPT